MINFRSHSSHIPLKDYVQMRLLPLLREDEEEPESFGLLKEVTSPLSAWKMKQQEVPNHSFKNLSPVHRWAMPS